MQAVIETPLGKMRICEDGQGISAVEFCDEAEEICGAGDKSENPLLRQCAKQLSEYFAGKRKKFGLPLSPSGTDFQKAVWKELENIPYGETATYGELAERIKNRKAARAVGMANHNNPISIIIPCHRCIGKDGSLTGYAGGLDKKAFLLELEKNNL